MGRIVLEKGIECYKIMNNKTPQDQLAEMDEYIRCNIFACCHELINQQDTGILPDGYIRYAIRMLDSKMFHDPMDIVFKKIYRVSMELALLHEIK